MVQVSTVTLFLLPLIFLMLWMDVALFVTVQHLPAGHGSPAEVASTGNTEVDADPPSDYSQPGIQSAFEKLTIKLLMLCPPMHYIELPLTGLFVHATNIAAYLSANAVSVIGFAFAAAAARLFYSPSYRCHLFGVLCFKIRDFLDSVDGEVASMARHQVPQQIPHPDLLGYLFDGVCDGLADLFVMVGIGCWMLREATNPGRHKTRYQKLLNVDSEDVDEKGNVGLPAPFGNVKLSNTDNPFARGLGCLISFLRRLSGNQLHYIMPILSLLLIVGLQIGFSCYIWNTTIYYYSLLFDTDTIAITISQQIAQNVMLKAPTTWIIIYTWRLLNPHSIMEYILIAILYGKIAEFLHSIKWLGFIILASAGCVTYMHYHYALATIQYA